MLKFIFSIILIFTASIEVFAYEQTEDFKSGFYWEKFPLKVHVLDPDNAESSRLNGLLERSFNEWEKQVDQDIWELSENALMVNTVRWSSDIEGETGYTAEETLGVAIRHQVGKYYQTFEIILNRNNEDLFNNVDNLLYNTIIHELGHTIGLGHTQKQGIMNEIVPNDIMLQQFQESDIIPLEGEGISRLSADDIDGMKEIVEITLHRQEFGLTSIPVNNCAASSTSAGSSAGQLSYLLSLIIGALMIIIPGQVFKRI